MQNAASQATKAAVKRELIEETITIGVEKGGEKIGLGAEAAEKTLNDVINTINKLQQANESLVRDRGVQLKLAKEFCCSPLAP